MVQEKDEDNKAPEFYVRRVRGMRLVIGFDENPLVATGSDDESTEEARKLLWLLLLSLSGRPTTSRVTATILLADQ